MRSESLRRHVREEHEGKGQPKIRGQGQACDLCQQTFKKRYLLNLHMKKLHNSNLGPEIIESKHCCEICGKSYARRECVRRHIREFHEGHVFKVKQD
jgi:hypothetical protein